MVKYFALAGKAKIPTSTSPLEPLEQVFGRILADDEVGFRKLPFQTFEDRRDKIRCDCWNRRNTDSACFPIVGYLLLGIVCQLKDSVSLNM